MSAPVGVKSAKVTLNPEHQTIESINLLVTGILGKAGCRMCGRLINLAFEFQGDPDPDSAKAGVISMETEGF